MHPDLTRLTQLLPRPTDAPSPAPDWEAAEIQLSTTLPSDYKELISTYGGGGIDKYLQLLEPGCPNDVFDLLRISPQREEANESLWEFDDKPAEMEEEGNRLLCWGSTDNGEYLFWLVRPGDDPDKRTIMINGETGEDWERYEMTVTKFLGSILSGDIHSEVLWDEFPLPVHVFRPGRELSPPA